jgi:hypothetical protein
MSVRWTSFATFFALGSVVFASSCRYGPPPVEHPSVNPAKAGRLAIEQYDTNGDGVVSGAELDQAPGLRAGLPRLDTNGDKAISADEVAARIEQWRRGGVALMSFACTVTLDGQPLSGATVTFEPESFLGDQYKTASGVTSDYGTASATIPKDQRPDPTLSGMHVGLYKVRISKRAGDRELIPPRYNEQTMLGQEVSRDIPEVSNHLVVYALKSK